MHVHVVVSLLLTAVLACQATPDRDWEEWKQKYNKVYQHDQHEARAKEVWLRHLEIVQTHNNRVDVTYSLEMNEFADLESKQDPRTFNSRSLSFEPEVRNNFLPRAPPQAPGSFDWRKKGVISPVKNQGMMGSSAAFAVAEDLESLHAIKTGKLVSLSEQEVSDCCSLVPGMLKTKIYECISKLGGLCSESGYPTGGTPLCKSKSCQPVANDADRTVFLPKDNESAIIQAVLEVPLVVYIDAGHTSFQLYKAGVYSDDGCTENVDHALQLVGYGEEGGVPYWILKNSWGLNWGMEGYVLLKRGVNMCGVADYVHYPTE